MFSLATVALPLGVSAEDESVAQDQESGSEEPVRGLQRWHPDAYTDPSGSSELDPVDPGDEPSSRFSLVYEGKEPNPYDTKVRNAKIGLGVSSLGVLVGGIVLAAGWANSNFLDFGAPANPTADRAIAAGIAVMSAAGLSLIGTAALLGVRKRKARDWEQEQRRVRWDPAKSRLAF